MTACGALIAAAPTLAETAVAVAAPGAGHDRAGAEQHGDDHLGLRLRDLLAHLGEMAARQMAGFVREHPDDLVGGIRFHQRAVVHEDAAAIGDEGVETGLVDDDDLDVLLFHARGTQDRPCVIAEQLLDFGVAQQRRTPVLLGKRRTRRNRQRRRGDGRDQSGDFAARCRAGPLRVLFCHWPWFGYRICPTKPWIAARLGRWGR